MCVLQDDSDHAAGVTQLLAPYVDRIATACFTALTTGDRSLQVPHLQISTYDAVVDWLTSLAVVSYRVNV